MPPCCWCGRTRLNPQGAKLTCAPPTQPSLQRPTMNTRHVSRLGLLRAAHRRCFCSAAAPPPRGSVTVSDAVGWLRAERAEDVTALDVSSLLGGAVGDAFVFGTGRSKPHMLRIAKAVKYELKERGVRTNNRTPAIEGQSADDWLLIDGGSVVVSVMVEAARARLALEQHWEAQGALRLDLPPADEQPVSSLLAAEALPGETLAPDEIPRPPRHWGAQADDAVLEEVYRERGDDDALLLQVESAAAERADGATRRGRAEDDEDDEDAQGEEYYEEEYVEYDYEEYDYGDVYDEEEYDEYDEYGYDDDEDVEEAEVEKSRPPPPR